MKPTLDKYGIDFVAVGLHSKLAEDFLEKSGFEGKLVINEQKDVFAGVKKAGYLSLLSPSVIRQIRKSNAMNLGGVMENLDGFQLGGLVVIDPPPKPAIIYQWDQPQMGTYPPTDEVLEKATEGLPFVELGDEKKIEEKEPVGVKTNESVAPIATTAESGDSKREDIKVIE